MTSKIRQFMICRIVDLLPGSFSSMPLIILMIRLSSFFFSRRDQSGSLFRMRLMLSSSVSSSKGNRPENKKKLRMPRPHTSWRRP